MPRLRDPAPDLLQPPAPARAAAVDEDEQSFVRSAPLGCIKVPSGTGKTEIPVEQQAQPVRL